jgi:ABC-2 type transport system ATP-binding protein
MTSSLPDTAGTDGRGALERGAEDVTVRRSTSGDEGALARLAALAGASPPRGPALVAMADERMLAALPLGSGRPIADPFEPTAELVALLELRRWQIAKAKSGSPNRRRGLRRLLRGRPSQAAYAPRRRAEAPTPVPPRSAAVSVRSLSKRYGELVAVDDLTFSLERGTITGFLGPNGAGKTTTLRLLLGLAEPTAGEALVFGRRYCELDEPARRVGAVLESNDFDPGRSGRNHLRALALATGVPYSRVEELLALVELERAAGRPVQGYSLGMRQRLGLAGALLGDPELLLLDEPANGLDPVGVRWLREFLRRLAREGHTVLVSSHGLAEVAQTVDRVLIIDSGRLIAHVRLDQLADGARSLEELYVDLTAKEIA